MNQNPFPPVWQFSLRELFGITTYLACSFAVVSAWGMGTLVAAAGFLVAWMNYHGRFRSIQSGRARTITIVIGSGLFIGAMFLPAYRIFADANGWSAAWVMMVLLAPMNSPSIGPPKWLLYFLHLPWIILTDAANVCGALFPLTLRWPAGEFRKWTGTVMYASLPVVWFTPTHNDDLPRFLIGFYVWAFALTTLASTQPIDRRTAQAMLVATSIFGITRGLAYLAMQTSG